MPPSVLDGLLVQNNVSHSKLERRPPPTDLIVVVVHAHSAHIGRSMDEDGDAAKATSLHCSLPLSLTVKLGKVIVRFGEYLSVVCANLPDAIWHVEVRCL